MKERVPPHDLDAERALLGSVFIRPAVLDLVADLVPDDFFLPAHREIFEAMRRVSARARAVDPIMVADELKAHDLLARLDGGLTYLTDLTGAVPTAENARHYGNIITRKSMSRRVLGTAAEIMSSCYGDVDPHGLLAELREKVARLELRGRSGSRRIGEEVERVVDAMEKRGMNPDRYGVRTGLRSLDEILGPMRPDNLIAIGANPSKGKTALAWNTAMRVASRGIPVLYFSLEMSIDQMIERGIAVDARIDTRQVGQGLMDKHEWHRVTGSIENFDKMPLWINDYRMNIRQLVGELRVWRAQRYRERIHDGLDEDEAKLALAVVDYAQLADPTDKRMDRREAMAEVSRELKLVTKPNDCNMPIIECLQLNRENMKGSRDGKAREPMLSDLRDAGEFEQDADAIMFPWPGKTMHRGRAENGYPDGPLYQMSRILLRKNRNGGTGDAKVAWEPQFTTWRDRTGDDETTEDDA